MVLSAENDLLAAASSSPSHVLRAFSRHWSLADPVSDHELTSFLYPIKTTFISFFVSYIHVDPFRIIYYLFTDLVTNYVVPICLILSLFSFYLHVELFFIFN